MKQFQFYFEGAPQGVNQMTHGIKLLSGNPEDIGKCMGQYAVESLKGMNQVHTAVIVIHAYNQMKKMMPDFDKVESDIMGAERGGIIYHL